MTAAIADEALATLEGFSGALLRPGEPGYDEARHIFNGLIDRRPALIARCHGEADIVAAVDFAREAGLEISVRGGGHSVAGRCIGEGGVMIDLSPMKGIYVDPDARTARAQPGVSWAELNRETQLHGLAVTGGVISTTGIAGPHAGRRSRLDSCRSTVWPPTTSSRRESSPRTAAPLTACESENPDLFWGLRGGSGNFGIVSSFEFRLHPVGPVIYGGLVAHPFERRRGLPPLLPRLRGRLVGRPHDLRRPRPCAGRLGDEARPLHRLPPRRRRSRRRRTSLRCGSSAPRRSSSSGRSRTPS